MLVSLHYNSDTVLEFQTYSKKKKIMKICILLVCAIFIIVVAKKTIENDWSTFKKVFHKVYNATEDKKRRLIWKKNVHKILEHNKKFPWNKLKVNELADLSTDEIPFTKLGYQPKLKAFNATNTFEIIYVGEEKLPAHVDWRLKGLVNPVRNQGLCASSWAFAATGAIEGQLAKHFGKKVILSPQNIVDCDLASNGCQGGFTGNAFHYVMRNKGIEKEESYPYKAVNGNCEFDRQTRSGFVKGYVELPSGDEETLKYAVANVGPIAAAIDSKSHTFIFKSGMGIYYDPRCNNTDLNHAILVVGYGTDNGQDYWLIKNSWGKHWGANGYAKMARNKNNHCGIASQASFPLVKEYIGP